MDRDREIVGERGREGRDEERREKQRDTEKGG